VKYHQLQGVKGYSEVSKKHNSYITPNIYKKDITECNDWDKAKPIIYSINIKNGKIISVVAKEGWEKEG